MDTSLLDNHPALQVIREEDSEEENDEIQVFPEHDLLNNRLSKSLYYGRETPSCDRLSLPVTELCVDYFNLAGFDTSLTGQTSSDLEITKTRLDRLDVERAAVVSRETCASPTSLVLALLYLERLRGRNPSYLHTVSSADIFLVSLLVASKFLHDDGEEDEVFNQEWAASAGMDKKDLNRLEIEFLVNIDWHCHVSTQQFEAMTDKVEKSVTQRQINSRRGNWTTYTDLHTLSRNVIPLRMIWERLASIAFHVTAVCLAAYAASLITMIGTCYALTRANLGPTAVSQSINTLKSAMTASSSSSKTMIGSSPSTVQTSNNTANTSDLDSDRGHPIDLSGMDRMSALEEELEAFATSATTGNFLSARSSNSHKCRNEQLQNSFYLLQDHHGCYKGKPPNYLNQNQNMTDISAPNDQTAIFPNETGDSITSGIPTFVNGGCTYDSYLKVPLSDDSTSDSPLKNKKPDCCDSPSSVRKFLTAFSLMSSWKMEYLLPPSPKFIATQNYISQQPAQDFSSCSQEFSCQNSWKDVLKQEESFFEKEYFWLTNGNVKDSSLSFRQRNAALLEQIGKAVIGF